MRPLLSTLCLLGISDISTELALIPADDTAGLADVRLRLNAWRAAYRRHRRTRL